MSNTILYILAAASIYLLVLVFVLDKVYGAETNPVSTIPQYVKEIKFQTCHAVFDIYNLTSYYKCVGM